ncbi:hypothetical protein [Actinokineospora pegani]|uniref:hypothetical protein n=1 Tax=Actinokineospora pegani TaxID=2654637 RepID=UPI0012E9E73C|nr:hypothetical protein [Actinokineospora pegani]
MTIRAGESTYARRVVRGVLLGFSSTALAVAAHGIAGGGVPDTAVTIVLAALVGWAGTGVADRHTGFVPTLLLLGGGQATLHVLLSHVAVAHPGETAPGSVLPTPLMLALHVVALLLTALLLTRASAAFATAAAALTGLVRAIAVVLPVAERPRGGPVVAPAQGTFMAVLLRRVCGKRGPPLPA